jgi:hypothetical protein
MIILSNLSNIQNENYSIYNDMRKYDFLFKYFDLYFHLNTLVEERIERIIYIRFLIFYIFLYLKKTKNCRKLIKSSSKIVNFGDLLIIFIKIG